LEGSDSACDATVVRGSVFDGDRSCMCLPDDVRPLFFALWDILSEYFCSQDVSTQTLAYVRQGCGVRIVPCLGIRT